MKECTVISIFRIIVCSLLIFVSNGHTTVARIERFGEAGEQTKRVQSPHERFVTESIEARAPLEAIIELIYSNNEAGMDNTINSLVRVDPSTKIIIEDLIEGDDYKYYEYSSYSLISALYYLGEVREKGGGLRFLAKLHREVSKESAALAIDPIMLDIRKEFTEEELDRKLYFADPQHLLTGQPLSSEITENVFVSYAIDTLTAATANPYIGDVVPHIIRHIKLKSDGETPDLAIDRVVFASKSRKEVIINAFSLHLPPPPLEVVLSKVIKELCHESGRFHDEVVKRFPDIWGNETQVIHDYITSYRRKAETDYESRVLEAWRTRERGSLESTPEYIRAYKDARRLREEKFKSIMDRIPSRSRKYR